MEGVSQMSGPQVPGGNAPQGEAPQMNGQAPQGEAPQMNGQAPQGEAPQMNGQAPQGEAPQMNGQAPQGEAPQMNGQAPQGEAPADNGQQTPEMNGQQAPQGEAPADNSQQAPQMNGQQKCQNGRPDGRGNGHHGKEDRGPQGGFVPFEDYVKDGTISQETYDAITKYMDENKPELPNSESSENASEDKKTAKNEKPEMNDEDRPDLLKDLLSAGVITQEEYDALVAKREAFRPSDNQEESTSQKTDTSVDA